MFGSVKEGHPQHQGTAFEKIAAKDFSLLPVVSRENPKRLLGIVTRRDMIGAYNSAVIKKPLLRE